MCTPNPRVPLVIRKVAEAEKQRRARAARSEARRAREAARRAAVVAAARANPYQDGADAAERFIRWQTEAGRTADQIEATHACITGPARERADVATQAQTERFRGYSDRVAAHLALLRSSQAAVEPAPAVSQEAGPGRGLTLQIPSQRLERRPTRRARPR